MGTRCIWSRDRPGCTSCRWTGRSTPTNAILRPTVRWSLLFAVPILLCALMFQWVLVTFEDWQINFFGGGHPYGAPFPVGVGWMPTQVDQTTPNPERFSSLWFAVDVMLTAAIAAVIAWFLRVRNAWPASVAATAGGTLFLFSPRPPSPPPHPALKPERRRWG